MPESHEIGLEELLTWLLYLMVIILPSTSLTATGTVLVTAEVYFVISAARAGRNVLRPEIPAGMLILNAGFMSIDIPWELRGALVVLSTLTFILWGLRVTLEVKA